ncbi:hypothetical protein MNVI_34910 [Mycobacterium noviomagense]|uniref:Uncharacterized protein n=1 Tax=Mycobacterium noviomagense TaxID=459858 RepID=A0A7I7PHS8_9MYCO|nr:hypothetical protein MNVI_34910 [Mycobacterium noviomagense]
MQSCTGPWPFDDRGLPLPDDPEVKVKPELVFMESDEEGIDVPETPSSTIKVKVNAPYRVVHDGKPHTGGDVLDVPDSEETKLLIRSGCVTPVPAKKEK